MASSWQLKVLTGRGLPSFPGGSSDCTVDLKIAPQQAFRKKLFREIEKSGMPGAVTCLGTRFDESVRRGTNMRERGDQADTPVLNKDGELVMAPIAHWSEDDVFEYLGYVSSGLLESYSNMEEVLRIYAHSAGTSCAVVASAIHSEKKPSSGGCGARHGCWTCQKTVDKSLEAMLAFDERYEYARGLNQFNKYVRATQFDWSLRHYVGRTIKGGYVEIKPDTYHPRFIRELTRMMLQLDYDEQGRARCAGEHPKFSILPVPMMIAVDAIQSLQGVAKPFQIWADLRDIKNGIRYDVPEVDTVPRTPMPPTRYLAVGDRWEGDQGRNNGTGLRDHYWEALTADRIRASTTRSCAARRLKTALG